MTRTETRDELIKVGTEIIGQHGFSTTGINAVLSTAGIPKGSFYYYFSSKEEVLYAIASEHIKLLYSELAAVATLPLPAEERFYRFVETFVERAADSRDEHLVLMKDVAFLPDDRREQLLTMEGKIVDVLIGLLEDINPGLLKPAKVKTPYAMLLFGMLIWTFTWYKKSGPVSPRELALRISKLFMEGLREGTFP